MALRELKAAGGYAMAVTAFIIVIITFVGNETLSRVFARSTGAIVSPRYSGGEVVKVIDHGTYRSFIHRPVFDGLFSDRSGGFIQIDWRGGPPWPERLEESIDYDRDGVSNLTVSLDTQTLKADVSAKDPSVGGIEGAYRLEHGFAVRIVLHKNHDKESPQ